MIPASSKTIYLEVIKKPSQEKPLCEYKNNIGWIVLPENYEERMIVIRYLDTNKLPRGYAIEYNYEGEEFL